MFSGEEFLGVEDFALAWGVLLSGDGDDLGEADHCDINESTVRQEMGISITDRPAIMMICRGSLVKTSKSRDRYKGFPEQWYIWRLGRVEIENL